MKEMTIKEAIEKGIRRVFNPIWQEKNSYVVLPKKNEDGTHGIWCKLYSEETQNLLGFPCPQEFLIHTFVDGLNSTCYKYNGERASNDKE